MVNSTLIVDSLVKDFVNGNGNAHDPDGRQDNGKVYNGRVHVSS